MILILGESDSDTDAVKHLTKRILGGGAVSIHTKPFDGCGDMLNRGHRILKLYHLEGCRKFIIVYDSDGGDAKERHRIATERIIGASGLNINYVVLIPIQEIEAWILADNKAIKHVIKTWKAVEVRHPERTPNPKEVLEGLSKGKNKKPRYRHALHNRIVAQHLDIAIVSRKCPSFLPLIEFLKPSG